MTKITHTEIRKVDGQDFFVDSLKRMEYNGEWTDDGYSVRSATAPFSSKKFVGYPANSDIKKSFGL